MLLAYLGPEAVLPLTSTLAAVAGLVLMFGRQFSRFLLMIVSTATRRATTTAKPARPRPKRATTRPDKVAT